MSNITSIEDFKFRHAPLRAYKEKYRSSGNLCSHGQAWSTMGENIGRVIRHLELDGDIDTAIRALINLQAGCQVNAERLGY